MVSKKSAPLGLTHVWPAAIFLIVLVLIVGMIVCVAAERRTGRPLRLPLRCLAILSA